MEFSKFDFTVGNTSISIYLRYQSNNGGIFIHADHFRPPSTPVVRPRLEEWLDDMNFMCEESGKNLFDTLELNVHNAFTMMCVKHIKQHGGLMDTDLYTYIDSAVLIMQALTIERGYVKQMLFEERAKEVWLEFKQYAFDSFRENIWVGD